MIKILNLLSFILIIPHALNAQSYQINHDGLTREYILHVPASYDGSSPVPLIFNFHGYGSSNIAQIYYTSFNNVADTAGFIVVYPNAVNNSWNVGFEGQFNNGIDDVGFVEMLIDSLYNRFAIDPARIYSTGMSNGGFFSYRLACELPGRFAAIASVTGTMTDTMRIFCPYTRDFPIMEVHGTNDQTVPYNGNWFMLPIDTVIAFWTTRNGAGSMQTINFPDVNSSDNSTVEGYRWGTMGADDEVYHLKVINGGHTWPGGTNISSLGVTNQDIRASGEIWDFFRRHQNPSPVTSISETPEKKLKLFPNPATDYFVVEGAEQQHRISIINLQGKTVAVLEGKSRFKIPESLVNGLYLIRSEEGLTSRLLITR